MKLGYKISSRADEVTKASHRHDKQKLKQKAVFCYIKHLTLIFYNAV